jgi:hypothetical protein
MFKTDLNDRLIGQRIGQRRMKGAAANFKGPKKRGDRRQVKRLQNMM